MLHTYPKHLRKKLSLEESTTPDEVFVVHQAESVPATGVGGKARIGIRVLRDFLLLSIRILPIHSPLHFPQRTGPTT